MISSGAGALARWISPCIAVAAVLGLGFSGQPVVSGPAPSIRLVSENNPLAGQPFFVDPISEARAAADRADPPNPGLNYIADTPTAYWADEALPTSSVASYVAGAQAAGALPILALYAVPHRDCYSYAAGGFGSASAYRQWIDGIAGAVGGAPAVIILEPDALAMADCLSPDQRQERFDLIRYAVDTLNRNPATTVYIDAGHSRWVSVEEMAARLNQAGIDQARGFSLNTANFFTTEEEIGYGDAISGLTNGANYVIDTGRNGVGPVEGDPLYWCNPAGRALGVPPTTATASPNVDAYLWVKRPGESDGSCDPGEPAAGRFVNQYAIDLARNAGQ